MELIGWLGSLLVVAAMLMTSMAKLRIINIVGSTLSVAYCVVAQNWPMVAMNACLIGINLYRLIQQYRKEKAAQA